MKPVGVAAPGEPPFGALRAVDSVAQGTRGAKTAGLIAVIAGGVFVVVAIAVGAWLGENSR